jgi:acetyltransferase-like isoleucine patch superfamily enzyme
MATRKIRLQVNFILLAVVNGLLAIVPTCLLRVALLRLFFAVSWKSAIHRGLRITSFIGPLQIGDHTVIGPHCLLDNRRGITIGPNANLTSSISVFTLGHDLNDPDRQTLGGPVTIESGAYLFTGAAVMPNVRIGRDAAIGAHSVLTHDVGSREFWAGNPAVFRKAISARSDRMNDYRYFLAL